MEADEDRLVGVLGYVTTRIGGGGRPGEVEVPLRGATERFIAYGDEPIDRGTHILVIGRRPGRAVDVTVFDG